MARKDKSLEAESISVVAWGLEGSRGWLQMGFREFGGIVGTVLKLENVLKLF